MSTENRSFSHVQVMVKGWGQQLEIMQYVCDSSLGSRFRESQDVYCDCHCKVFPLVSWNHPARNFFPFPEHGISYIGDEYTVQCVWVWRCPEGLFKWGSSVLLLVMLHLSVCFLEISQGIPSKTLCQRWAELTGLAVSTWGCFGLQGLSKHLGRQVTMLPMGQARRIVKMFSCFRMSEACV